MRAYSERVYGIPPEQVVGTMFGRFELRKDGKPVLIKEPKLLLNDDNAGKPEGIHLVIGRRPHFAFGNSHRRPADARIYEGGRGARLAMLVLHDDGAREYAYGPAQGLPDTKSAASPRTLRRGEQERLDRRQHEERLEAHFRLRVAAGAPRAFTSGSAPRPR